VEDRAKFYFLSQNHLPKREMSSGASFYLRKAKDEATETRTKCKPIRRFPAMLNCREMRKYSRRRPQEGPH